MEYEKQKLEEQTAYLEKLCKEIDELNIIVHKMLGDSVEIKENLMIIKKKRRHSKSRNTGVTDTDCK